MPLGLCIPFSSKSYFTCSTVNVSNVPAGFVKQTNYYCKINIYLATTSSHSNWFQLRERQQFQFSSMTYPKVGEVEQK